MGRAVQPHIITPDSVLGGRNIERSVRFNTADSTEFYNNSLGTSMTGNRQICTVSVWIKKINTSASGMIEYGYSGSGASASGGGLKWDSSSRFFVTQEVNNSTVWKVATTRVFRDFTNWYHVVAAVDTTQGTASNRVKIYVNGVQETDFSTSSYPSQNYSSNNLGYNKCRIGASNGYAGQLYYSGFNGYLAEYHFIDGQQLDPSYFGYTESQTGIWRPKKVTGVTYGNNGHYLDFRDNSSTTTLGYDRSGNGLNFASNNISVSAGVGNDSLEDTPTNNFSILSPLSGRGTYFQTPSQGGLNFSLGSHIDVMSSFVIPDSGKWYAEFVFTTVASGAVGVCNLDKKNDGTSAANALNGINYNGSDIKVNDSSVQSSLTAIGDNDVIGVQVDRDAGTVQFTNDGSNVGTPVNISSMNAPFDIMFNLYRNSSGGSTPVGYANFGQRPFSYLPSGFRSLCDKNMATPTASSVVDPKKHFNCILYTPNSGNLSVTGVGFKPDLLWLKSATQGYRHYMFDSIRGTGAKAISSNLDAVEGNDSGGALGSFDSDGFSVGGSTGFNDNGSGTDGCVAWCWKAGISTSSNTAGDVTSTVSVNEEAGFSMVSFAVPAGTGFSIGHGLSKAPETIWMKNRSYANNWDIYHHKNGTNPEQYRLIFNSTSGRQDQPYLDDTVPTSSVFRTRGGGNWYNTGNNIIAYCFYSVPGFSKMGSYNGTGDANGPFVYTGFRPAMVIIKRIDTTEDWWIHDDQRNPHNPINKNLYPNGDYTTATEVASDFLSNGFKLRTSNQNWNDDGDTYVYWAWAGQVGNTPYIASTNAR